MLTIRELTKIANDFLMEEYGLLLTIPLKLNGRLKTSQGRFISRRNRHTGESYPQVVELNKFMVETNSNETVINILKHELVHYALYMKKLPNKDGHPIFENELRKLGVVSQSNIQEQSLIMKVQIYRCKNCNKEFVRKTRLRGNLTRYSCQCGGKLADCGKVAKVI